MDINNTHEKNSISFPGVYPGCSFYGSNHLEKKIEMFWVENPVFHQLVLQNSDLESIRKRVFNYIADFERKTLNNQLYLNVLDRNIARKCINVLKNVFAKRSEDITGFSALELLIEIAHHRETGVSLGFLQEMRSLFLGMKGKTGLSGNSSVSELAESYHLHSVRVRSGILDSVSDKMKTRVSQYKSGLDEDVIIQRWHNRKRIMNILDVTPEQWNDWVWQRRHIIRDSETLGKLIELTSEEKDAIDKAVQNGLPFGITPYYASLMERASGRRLDHAVRAQVIPPCDYVDNVMQSKQLGVDMDFMGEKDTSPMELITRRYPMIAILKPYNTCAQICVYCQRNWEIDNVLSEKAAATENKLDKALEWCEQNTAIEEVLVTGGDPGIMSDCVLRKVLRRLAEMKHIRRIRIGTRVPVVLPMRITGDYAELLAGFIEPGRREVVVMTHFEHPYEVTPESLNAVQILRAKGIPVYNQTVFTVENSRRFEMVSLRRVLRLIGVDPYYTFNTKGKDETRSYRVPVARLIQEQVEEARLTPGLDRTDEAVFNIPRLGKSYLRAGQDHEVVMVLPNGGRVYEFFPWGQNFLDTKPYLYEDIPVFDFLTEMHRRGEDTREYRSIWYYF